MTLVPRYWKKVLIYKWPKSLIYFVNQFCKEVVPAAATEKKMKIIRKKEQDIEEDTKADSGHHIFKSPKVGSFSVNQWNISSFHFLLVIDMVI